MARVEGHGKGSAGRKAGRDGRPIEVELVVTERCFGSGIAVTLDVLSTASLVSGALGGPSPIFDCAVRSLDGRPVSSSVGKPITVDGPIGERDADVVLVFGPGMADVSRVLVDIALPETKALARYLEQAAGRGALLCASCSSTFVLAEAGILDGEVGVTARTLGRHFVAATGLPPASFLRRLRMETAAGRLRSSTDSIASIAAYVGYDDERAFRRAFTKDMGDSPSHYRRAAPAAAKK